MPRVCGAWLQVLSPLQGPYVIACDGDEVHGVVHGLEDAQDGAECLLEVLGSLTALAVFQHLLGGQACVHTPSDTEPTAVWRAGDARAVPVPSTDPRTHGVEPTGANPGMHTDVQTLPAEQPRGPGLEHLRRLVAPYLQACHPPGPTPRGTANQDMP